VNSAVNRPETDSEAPAEPKSRLQAPDPPVQVKARILAGASTDDDAIALSLKYALLETVCQRAGVAATRTEYRVCSVSALKRCSTSTSPEL
jgi:hypothetical protein